MLCGEGWRDFLSRFIFVTGLSIQMSVKQVGSDLDIDIKDNPYLAALDLIVVMLPPTGLIPNFIQASLGEVEDIIASRYSSGVLRIAFLLILAPQ